MGTCGSFWDLPDYGTAAGLEGLQTRSQVQQLIQGQVGAGGSSGMAALQSNLESAHQQLDQFKDKLSSLGSGSGDMDMPDFKPNQQKTRSFLQTPAAGHGFTNHPGKLFLANNNGHWALRGLPGLKQT